MTNKAILDIFIISHERPSELSNFLEIIYPNVRKSSDIRVIVLDNSIAYCSEINKLVSKYPEFKIYQSEGCTQVQNFLRVLEYIKSEYALICHDDDALYIENSETFINNLKNSSSNLSYLQSLKINDKKLSIKSFPTENSISKSFENIDNWRLPLFPSWIYRNTELFRHTYLKILSSRVAGKYTDTCFIYSLFTIIQEQYNETPQCISSAIYLCRNHELQDSATDDTKARIKLYGTMYKKNLFLYSKAITLIFCRISKKSLKMLLQALLIKQ